MYACFDLTGRDEPLIIQFEAYFSHRMRNDSGQSDFKKCLLPNLPVTS
jgi:hypothetical protein